MAETAEVSVEPIPSSSENPVESESKSDDGPTPEKRRKIDDADHEKLEYRLGGILCCAVCLDLPPAAVYQCTNGHLMCAPCFTHLLADARLRDEASTCPNCRVEISKTSASRNLAVEKTVSELPSECKYCAKVFPRHSLQHHEEKKCEERSYKFSQMVVSPAGGLPFAGLFRILCPPETNPQMTGCRYACIGCPWRGPHHEAAAHETACLHPGKSAAEVVAVLDDKDRHNKQEQLVYNQVLDLLSYEKITFNDLQLRPYRTEEYVHKLYYETSRFSAFAQQWVLKAYVNKNQRDPTQSYEREISYQLILKSKTSCPLHVQWVALRGPYGEANIRPAVMEHCFTEEAADSAAAPLPLADPHDTNRLLSNKHIHFRLIMFLASK